MKEHREPNVSGGAAAEGLPADLTAEYVETFLREHPDFLAARPELLMAMTPPERWQDDGVIDLQQHIVRGLRDELDALRTCAREFVDVSRVNLEVQSRAHAAVLALLGTTGIAEAVVLIRAEFPRLLGIAAARVAFERRPGHHLITSLGLDTLPEGTVARLVPGETGVALVSRVSDDGAIFDKDAERVRSAAFARIRPLGDGPVGLLALGGAETLDFHAGQAIDLVAFLSRVVERYIHAWLDRRA